MSNKTNIVININPEDPQYIIYHPKESEILNKEVLKPGTNSERIDSQYLCMSCDQIMINPEECSVCKVRKCKECEPICFHTENYYVEMKIPELNQLVFKCVNDCGNKIPYNQIVKHYEYMCPKFGYRKNFEKVYEEFSATEQSYDKLEIELNNLKKIHTQILRNNLGIRNSSNSVKLNVHKHELTFGNCISLSTTCSYCHKFYMHLTKAFFCHSCFYTLCPMCFVLLTTQK